MGKSTSAVNLAAALALDGHRVLLIDTDTQGQAAGMLGVKLDTSQSYTLADVLDGSRQPSETIISARENLDLLAGGADLARAAREIARRDFGAEYMLSEALTDFASGYDVTLVDTSPGWDALSANVLFFATEVLAPVSLDALALDAFARFVQRIADVQRYRQALQLRYVLPTHYDRRIRAPGEVLNHLKAFTEGQSLTLLPAIRYSVRLSEAPGHGQTIFEYAATSTGAIDYAAAARALLQTT